jgi:putative MFS transporter
LRPGAAAGSHPDMEYRNRTAFWGGLAAVTAGVLLHLPMFIGASDMDYMLVGMGFDGPMIVGMGLILGGLAATGYGLFAPLPMGGPQRASHVRVRALDEAPIKPAHLALLAVLAAAVTIDVMKPVTLGFVVPGMAKEYGLKSPVNPGGSVPVALLPLAGISGTVVGSFLWGELSDRVGRRASILFAGVLFVATAICGSMPGFEWNIVMCFVMGLGVGGMLPITFALIAETVPARHRGWLMVLIGGDVAGGYILVSWLSSVLTPEFGWRILWLLGLPTGLLLLLLNRWIPESPRFLIARGRDHEAREVMARYGAEAVGDEPSELAAVERSLRGRWRELGGAGLRGSAVAVSLFGIGVGLVTFGFQLWIPSNLQKLGFNEVTSDEILRDSALIGFPVTIVIALLYGFWSSRRTMILLGLGTAVALLGFVFAGDEVANDRTLLYALLVVPITGISSVLAAVIAYSSEVFPTKLRSRGTGLAAGASKAGGVLVIALVAAAVAPPSIAYTALIGAVPMALAGLAIAVFGHETRNRRLEEIAAEELAAPGPA